jgi:hypothetical protein
MAEHVWMYGEGQVTKFSGSGEYLANVCSRHRASSFRHEDHLGGDSEPSDPANPSRGPPQGDRLF